MRTESRRPAMLLALVALLAACSGSVDFGKDRGGPTSADAGAVSTDAAVLQSCSTTFPTQWPFPATADAYTKLFWTPVSAASTCGSSPACHNVSSMTPFVPGTMGDVQPQLGAATMSLMAVASGGTSSILTTFHAAPPGDTEYGAGTTPPFAQVLPALRTLVDQMSRCAPCVGGNCGGCSVPSFCTNP